MGFGNSILRNLEAVLEVQGTRSSSLVLLDNSIMTISNRDGFRDCETISQCLETLKLFYDNRDSVNIRLLPEVQTQFQDFYRLAKKVDSTYHRLRKGLSKTGKMKRFNNSVLPNLSSAITKMTRYKKGLFRRTLDCSNSEEYCSKYLPFVIDIEDKLGRNSEGKHSGLRTDAKIVASALYEAIENDKHVLILSNDSRIFSLLGYVRGSIYNHNRFLHNLVFAKGEFERIFPGIQFGMALDSEILQNIRLYTKNPQISNLYYDFLTEKPIQKLSIPA